MKLYNITQRRIQTNGKTKRLKTSRHKKENNNNEITKQTDKQIIIIINISTNTTIYYTEEYILTYRAWQGKDVRNRTGDKP